MCEHTFVSVKGSPYARFQRALRLGHLDQIRDAAAELPQVDLVDALQVCLLMGAQRDARYDRAATRWLARFALERQGVTLDDVRAAVAALDALPRDPVWARRALGTLCDAHGLARAAEVCAAAD
jgi:hypothetical protein